MAHEMVWIAFVVIVGVAVIVLLLIYTGKLNIQGNKAECDALVRKGCGLYLDTKQTTELDNLKSKCGFYEEYSWLGNSGQYDDKCETILGK